MQQPLMEETKKRVLSLPPNYVTLQQLKEQRLKEQQEKQRKKEEEERRKELEEERLKEERQKQKEKEEEEEERLRLQIIKESQVIKVGTVASIDRPYRRNHQKFPRKPNLRKQKDDHSVLQREETEIVGAEEIQNPDENFEETKEKKKSKKWRKNRNRKLKEEKTLIGYLEKSPLENNPKEIMPEVPHEKAAGKGKINGRDRVRRWEKKTPSEQVEVSVNPTVEIDPEVSQGKAAVKVNDTRNGSHRWEKRSPSEQVEVSVNPSVEIESEPPHAGKMKTRNGNRRRGKRPPSEPIEISIKPSVEIDPIVPPEKAAGNMEIKKGLYRRESRTISEQTEVSKYPTDEIDRKFGDLTVGDGKQKSTTEMYRAYSRMRNNPKRFGYSGKTTDANHIWVKKDEKEAGGNSGTIPYLR